MWSVDGLEDTDHQLIGTVVASDPSVDGTARWAWVDKIE